MIKAKHLFIFYHFFRLHSLWNIRRNFHKVELNGEFIEKGKPILIIANHISWWDGFWVVYFRQKVVKRRFHFMMLEEQLQKNWFLRFTGGFSINKNSKTIIETLQYTQKLLENNENMVLVFPQGKIESQHLTSLKFEQGIQRIVNKSKKAQIIFTVHLIDYLSNKKPTLFIYFKEFETTTHQEDIEEQYNIFYQSCLEIQKQKTE